MSQNKGKITVTMKIREQILKMRIMDECPNMLDITEVQRFAYNNGFFELVNLIQENRGAYTHFIFCGDENP